MNYIIKYTNIAGMECQETCSTIEHAHWVKENLIRLGYKNVKIYQLTEVE